MYEMSTGVLPFEGETPVAVALKHLQQQPRPPIDIEPNVPRGVNDIILKAIRKEQNARYQSAAEMTEDLYKVLRQPEGGFVRNVISEKASTKKVMAVGGRNSYGEDNDGFYGTSAHRDIGNYNMDDLSNVNATNGNPYNKYNNYDDMPPYGPGNRMRTGYNGNDKNKIIKRNVLIAAGIISLLVIAIIIGFVRANSKNEKEGYYTMESFVNQDINEVLEKLKAKSWDTNMYVTVDKVNSDKPKDEVIEQSWKAGQELEINKDTINFKVSNGEKAIEKIEIPDDLVGEDYHDVEDRLKELGFTSIRTEGEAAEYKKDLVTRIEPEPGEKLEPNEEITIYYSLGKEETKKISVPNLINYTKDDAQAMLYSMGLKVGTLTPNDAPGDAKVIAQNPKVGVQVDENYEVDLTFEVASPSPSPSPSPQKVFKVINLREEHFQGSGPYNVEIIATAQDGSENFQQNYGPYNSFGDVPNNGRLRIQVNKNVPYNIEVKVNGVVVMNGT